MLTHSALASILAGVSMHYAALLAMLATAIFDHLFIKAISQQWTGELLRNFTQTLQIDGFS